MPTKLHKFDKLATSRNFDKLARLSNQEYTKTNTLLRAEIISAYVYVPK